jgi:hypothetical protein
MRTAMTGRRAVLAALVAWAGAALLLAGVAAPAHAFGPWIHDSVPVGPGADACYFCHGDGSADNGDCTSLCHGDFKVTPSATVSGRFATNCWSCHEPGSDTSSLSSPSAACSQDCHLYSPVFKAYIEPFSHGAEPHLGASPPYGECLDCHSTSVGISDPGSSPHHDGSDWQVPGCTDCHNGIIAGAQQSHDAAECEACHEGMDRPASPAACNQCHLATTFGTQDCLTCHADQVHNTTPSVGTCTSCHTEGYRQHAGEVSCTTCHTNAPKSHHGTAAAVAKTCRSCHAMKHAGSKVSGARCADCHKGSTPAFKPRAQHSTTVTKKYVCSGCHAKKLHASAAGASTTCRSCHKGKYHAAQATVKSSACLTCHPRASSHAGGLACVRCHKSVVHDRTP